MHPDPLFENFFGRINSGDHMVFVSIGCETIDKEVTQDVKHHYCAAHSASNCVDGGFSTATNQLQVQVSFKHNRLVKIVRAIIIVKGLFTRFLKLKEKLLVRPIVDLILRNKKGVMTCQASDLCFEHSLLALTYREDSNVRPCENIFFKCLGSLFKPAKVNFLKDPVWQDVWLCSVILISRALLHRKRYIVVEQRQVFAPQPILETLRVQASNALLRRAQVVTED